MKRPPSDQNACPPNEASGSCSSRTTRFPRPRARPSRRARQGPTRRRRRPRPSRDPRARSDGRARPGRRVLTAGRASARRADPADTMGSERRVAIVTGASRELGAEMAVALARTGAAVVVAHHGEGGSPTAWSPASARTAASRTPSTRTCRRSEANRDLVDFAVDELGRLDVFVANAGLTRWSPFLEMDEATWDEVVDLNLKGSYFGAQAAARRMVAQGDGGRIVFSSSVTGIVAAGEPLRLRGDEGGARAHGSRARASSSGSTGSPSTRSRSARRSTSGTSATTRSTRSTGPA